MAMAILVLRSCKMVLSVKTTPVKKRSLNNVRQSTMMPKITIDILKFLEITTLQ